MAKKKSAPRSKSTPATVDELEAALGECTYESATSELEAIIQKIEDGEIGLEASLVERRRAEALIRRCRSILDAAEAELETLDGDDPAASS